MKTINFITTLAIITFTFNVFSQETPVKRIKISDFLLYSGTSFERTNRGILNDFKALAPESELLKQEMLIINKNQGYSYMSNNNFSVLVGFQFSDKDRNDYRPDPLLRLGLTYSSGSSLSSYNYGDIRSPFDTLTSSLTGEETYIDSIYAEYYSMNYESQQIQVNASMIFRTDPEERWSIFSGIGFTAGVSINANTSIHYSSEEWKEVIQNNTAYSNNNYQRRNTVENEFEFFTNKTNYGFSAYIPLGVDFRIGNKKEFWKKTHLFYEVQPTLSFNTIPELETMNKVNFRHGFGVRVNFN